MGRFWSYVYSLPDLQLIAKKRYMKANSTQDGGFTFSSEGDAIISVDHYHGIHRCIIHYEVPTLNIKTRYFDDSDVIEPFAIELSPQRDALYALMMEQNGNGIVHKYSVALIKNGKIQKSFYIPQDEFELYAGLHNLRSAGFTDKAKEWSLLAWKGYDITDIEKQDYSIAQLFASYGN